MMNIKKISAFVLMMAMVLAFSITAYAADLGESGVVSSDEKTIVIKKEIIAFNPLESDVNAPTITYSYQIAPGSSGKTVKDANGVGTSTIAGVEGATITGTVSWSAASERLHTAKDGLGNTKDITIGFSSVVFPYAGVYRYKITETATYTDTGVVDGGSHIRYLDVYVRNSATAGQFDIYGYVLFTNDNNIDGTSNATDEDKVSAAAKTMGFVGQNADKYYTYNLTIAKQLSGDTGMNNHQFPFGISFSGSETAVLPIITKTGNATIPAWSTAGSISSFNATADSGNLKIANGGIVTVTGIPVGTSVEIYEKNDVTGTTYQVATTGADTNVTSMPIAPSESSGTAGINVQTAGNAEDKNVIFTNTLSLISPTGYVSRYAPYGLILIAGIVLLVVAKRHKKHTDED